MVLFRAFLLVLSLGFLTEPVAGLELKLKSKLRDSCFSSSCGCGCFSWLFHRKREPSAPSGSAPAPAVPLKKTETLLPVPPPPAPAEPGSNEGHNAEPGPNATLPFATAVKQENGTASRMPGLPVADAVGRPSFYALRQRASQSLKDSFADVCSIMRSTAASFQHLTPRGRASVGAAGREHLIKIIGEIRGVVQGDFSDVETGPDLRPSLAAFFGAAMAYLTGQDCPGCPKDFLTGNKALAWTESEKNLMDAIKHTLTQSGLSGRRPAERGGQKQEAGSEDVAVPGAEAPPSTTVQVKSEEGNKALEFDLSGVFVTIGTFHAAIGKVQESFESRKHERPTNLRCPETGSLEGFWEVDTTSDKTKTLEDLAWPKLPPPSGSQPPLQAPSGCQPPIRDSDRRVDLMAYHGYGMRIMGKRMEMGRKRFFMRTKTWPDALGRKAKGIVVMASSDLPDAKAAAFKREGNKTSIGTILKPQYSESDDKTAGKNAWAAAVGIANGKEQDMRVATMTVLWSPQVGVSHPVTRAIHVSWTSIRTLGVQKNKTTGPRITNGTRAFQERLFAGIRREVEDGAGGGT